MSLGTLPLELHYEIMQHLPSPLDKHVETYTTVFPWTAQFIPRLHSKRLILLLRSREVSTAYIKAYDSWRVPWRNYIIPCDLEIAHRDYSMIAIEQPLHPDLKVFETAGKPAHPGRKLSHLEKHLLEHYVAAKTVKTQRLWNDLRDIGRALSGIVAGGGDIEMADVLKSLENIHGTSFWEYDEWFFIADARVTKVWRPCRRYIDPECLRKCWVRERERERKRQKEIKEKRIRVLQTVAMEARMTKLAEIKKKREERSRQAKEMAKRRWNAYKKQKKLANHRGVRIIW